MTNLICSRCNNSVGSNQISICPDCGAFVCEVCSEANGLLCGGCYGRLSRLS